jgi:tetratricopeptide (TPR) repeat protein
MAFTAQGRIETNMVTNKTTFYAALIALSIISGSIVPSTALAQTVDLSLPQGTRQPGDLAVAEQKRVQGLYDSALTKRKAGQVAEALIDAEAGLLVVPRDLSLRFLRAVILNQQGKTEQAINAFELLTQEYPELPEPHNNVAVLYAQKGEIDKARASLLRALSIFPAYAVAQENLGDVYIRMAQQAYAAGNKADGRNTAIATKLKLTSEWLVTQGIAVKAN